MLINEAIKPISSEDRLIPMINIVFLLLIFFMIMGHIEKQSDNSVILPSSSSFFEKNQETTVVSVTSDGTWYLNEQAVSFANLEQQLALLEHKNITLKADFNLKNSILNALLDVLREQNWQNVNLIVLN